ncbi:MAG: hypothetical protein ACTSWY_06580, partial [Promethearchaeota archaeon]
KKKIVENVSITDYKSPPENAVQILDENWKKFSANTMNSFNDMKEKIDKMNQQNLKKMEEKIKIGKANYKIWLKKKEIRNASIKEQQKLAMERFLKWKKENQDKSTKFFGLQQHEWENQLGEWKKETVEAPGKWNVYNQKRREKYKANNLKRREKYEAWLKRRRDKMIKSQNFMMKLGWRFSFNLMIVLLPIIIIIMVISALISNFS